MARGTKSICRAVSPDSISRFVPLQRCLSGRLESISTGVNKWNMDNTRRYLHIILELEATRQGLLHCIGILQGKTVAVFSDSTTALSYLVKEVGTHSTTFNTEA